MRRDYQPMTLTTMKTPPTVRDLYPHLTDEELEIVEDQLERYLALVLRIFKRMEKEGKDQLYMG